MTRREVELKHDEDLDYLRELCEMLADPDMAETLSKGARDSARVAYSLRVTPALVADLIDLIPRDEKITE